MAIALPILLGLAAIAIDGSNIYYQSQRMQISADAAALGGARKLAVSAAHDEVDSEIHELALANHADAVTWEYINDNRGVHVVAMRGVPAFFARIYGQSVFTITASADAQYEPVTGVDGLFPLTLDCDCVDEEDIIPVDEVEGGGGGASATATPTPITDNTPSAGTVELRDDRSSSYGITYLGQSGNTWSYQVEELAGRDLSHWLLNINTCLSNIVSYTPGGAEIGTDGSTGVPGIKWNVSDGFSSGTFTFTLDDTYPAGDVLALAKAGPAFGTVSIRGPICDGTNTGTEGGNEGGSSGSASLCLPTLEFETDSAGAALVAGQIIDTEWAAWGVRVTTHNPSSHPAMIFNTANPTGGDTDLGAPNQAFGGPGVGAGGGPGMPGANNAPLGKVLIIAETPNATNPDDSANGGTLIFTFDYPVRIDDVRILDIDNASAAGTIKAFKDTAGTTLVATGKMQGFGDNSVQTVAVNGRDVRRLEIKFPASGAVASIVSCRSAVQPAYRLSNLVWHDLDGDGIQDVGEPGIAGVKLELYLAGQNYVIATAISNAGGEYVFHNLPIASYEVKIAPSNFQPGGVLAGASYSPKDATGNGSGGVTPTAPPTNTPLPTPTQTPTPTSAANYCQVTYTVTEQWGNGFNADVTIKNLSGTAWGAWNVQWQFGGNQQITNAWNGTRSQNGQQVTIAHAGWNATVPANNSVSFGFQASYSGANPTPTNFVVNGMACTGSGGSSGGGSSSPTATPTPTATTGGAGPSVTPAACTVDKAAISGAVNAMNQYGLITLNDLQSFGEVDHFAFIGGNLLAPNSVQFGTHATGVACSTRVLSVVGDIAYGGPLNIQKGSLALKGSLNGRMVNYNGGQGCGLAIDGSLSAAGITAYMQSASASLASIPANNADPVVNAGGNLMFNVTSTTANGLAVFDISGTQLFNAANGVIEFANSANATTILVNVSGSSLNWTHGNMGNWLTSYSANISKVIWNFHQATSINTNSRRFAGAILAPYANMNAESGNLEGSVVVKNLVRAGEIHNPVFSLGNTVPLTTACGEPTVPPPPTNTPSPTPTTPPTATPTPGVNDDTIDSDFDPVTGRAPAIISTGDNPTVDGGFILPDTGPESAIINLDDGNNSRYEVTLVGTSGNTWTYRVRKLSGRDLSYWSLGINNCLANVVSYSPTSTYASGIDASTGFVGVKWTVAPGFTDGTFSFTLDGSYQARPVQALVKADTLSAQVSITGPDCTLPNTETPDDPSENPGTGGGGGSEGNACSFGWIDWNGGVSSQMELASYMANTELSGVHSLNEVLTRGPDVVYSPAVAAELEELKNSGATVKIPLTTFNGSGYAICGFANVKLLDYELDEDDSWLNLQFLQDLIRGIYTDPNAPDYGARDVRFEK